jgi:hypothetical protein
MVYRTETLEAGESLALSSPLPLAMHWISSAARAMTPELVIPLLFRTAQGVCEAKPAREALLGRRRGQLGCA